MDSATQFVLGACVGAAVLGPRIGPRKAVILGGLLGTVPDLDVFYPLADPVDEFTLHRGPTHSFFIHALATPIFGEAILRVFRAFREAGASADRVRVYLAVFLCFTTHALIDAATIYGTRLFWPIWPEPLGLGSVFIIDPLYTLPLLVVTLWALFQGAWGPRFRKACAAALTVSTLYMGWGVFAQSIALDRAVAYVGEAFPTDRAIAIPTPFNTVFWRVVLLSDEHYLNVYVPLLGEADDISSYLHPRRPEGLACDNGDSFTRLTDFADDFVRFDRETADQVAISDLRMGMTPYYAFRYGVPIGGEGAVKLPDREDVDVERGLAWVLDGAMGSVSVRHEEAEQVFDIAQPLPEGDQTPIC